MPAFVWVVFAVLVAAVLFLVFRSKPKSSGSQPLHPHQPADGSQQKTQLMSGAAMAGTQLASPLHLEPPASEPPPSTPPASEPASEPPASPAKDVFELVGTVIDERYRVDSVVGEGGFGVVYRAYHLGFEQHVALKCLKIPHHFSDEGKTTFLRKFKEEGKILLKLSHHPAIVRVFDLGATRTKDRIPYLVLEWLDGKGLAQTLDERRAAGKPFDEREMLRVLRPVIEALSTAHAESIAHRDIKPENIFLLSPIAGAGKSGASPAKLFDFGIAKAMHEGDRATRIRTASTFSAFSPKHGAPEQFSPKKFGETGPWTDVHAIGLLMTEMLTGREAFAGEEFGDMLLAATQELRPTPGAFGTVVSAECETLIAKCVALQPSQRFQDATSLLAEVDRLLGAPDAV